MHVKFIYSEKATKIWRNLQTFFDKIAFSVIFFQNFLIFWKSELQLTSHALNYNLPYWEGHFVKKNLEISSYFCGLLRIYEL